MHLLAMQTDASVSQIITQLGMGGIVILLVLREVFAFLNKRKENGNGSNGSDPRQTQLWELKIEKIVADQVKTANGPLLKALETTNATLAQIERNTNETMSFLKWARDDNPGKGAHA